MARLFRRIALTVAILAASVAPAFATSFTLSSFTVDVHDSDPGLVMWADPASGGPVSFDLAGAGDSYTTKLFTVGTSEGSVNFDDLVPYPISVTFNFSSPAPGFGGTSEGITGAIIFTDIGYLGWDNPLLLSFSGGGLLAVSLSGGLFGLPGALDVNATFSLVKAGTGSVSVPEPTSLLLLLMGVAMVALLSTVTSRPRRTGC